MNRSIIPTLRFPIALAAVAMFAACGGTVDFDVSQSIDVNEQTATAWSGEAAVDLATEAPDAWKQRKHIDSIEVVAADATITAVPAGNVATQGSGSAWFRPDGATDASKDVLIGSWPATAQIKVGTVIDLTPSAALSAFITDVLKGSGKFTVVASGEADAAPVIFTVKLHVGCKLKWALL